MNFTLKIWRQKDAKSKGAFNDLYGREHLARHLVPRNAGYPEQQPRSTRARSPWRSTTTAARASAACARCTSTATHTGPSEDVTTCQLLHAQVQGRRARSPSSRGARAAFPVIKDLVVEPLARTTRFCKPEASSRYGTNSSARRAMPFRFRRPTPTSRMDAAACIGCGACAATCKNGSAMLFVAARVSSLAKLPQGRVEGARRAKAMVAKMDELGFGNCTEHGCLPGRMPQGDLHRAYRPSEPRVPVGKVRRTKNRCKR